MDETYKTGLMFTWNPGEILLAFIFSLYWLVLSQFNIVQKIANLQGLV